MSIGPSIRPQEKSTPVSDSGEILSSCVWMCLFTEEPDEVDWCIGSGLVMAVHIIILSDACYHARKSVFQTDGSWQYSLKYDYSNPN